VSSAEQELATLRKRVRLLLNDLRDIGFASTRTIDGQKAVATINDHYRSLRKLVPERSSTLGG
jgi:hypothetical protein